MIKIMVSLSVSSQKKDAVFVLAPLSGRIWNKKLKIQPLQREDESSPSCKVMKAEQSPRKRFRTDLKRKIYEHIYFFKINLIPISLSEVDSIFLSLSLSPEFT